MIAPPVNLDYCATVTLDNGRLGLHFPAGCVLSRTFKICNDLDLPDGPLVEALWLSMCCLAYLAQCRITLSLGDRFDSIEGNVICGGTEL